MGTIYFILKEDMVYYPPVLSIINVCLDLGYGVVYVGTYTDEIGKSELKNRGVVFVSTNLVNEEKFLLGRVLDKVLFKNQVYTFLKNTVLSDSDYIWLFHTDTLCLLNKLTNRYHVIFHPLEFSSYTANWKYKIISPTINLPQIIRKSSRIVCCEYNRAQITKGILSLKKLPYVLPNKMYLSNEDWYSNIPTDIQLLINPIISKLKGKKVILYQSVFLNKERRLEEFCEAVNVMPNDFVLIAMGRGSKYYDELKEKYDSDRIIFIPFIRPPYHLLITQIASIGVLSYIPDSSSFASVINPLYCAPNKIFEYARYGVPMISNDIPGLSYIFKLYGCGEVVSDLANINQIIEAINGIMSSYSRYSKGATLYYESIDVKGIVKKILLGQ